MRKTDQEQEVDDALVYIRQSTAVPIQRFLESVTSERLEQGSLHDNHTMGPPKLGLWRGAGDLRKRFKDLVSSLGATLTVQSIVRIVHRICSRRSRDEPEA
jgi:hypothetical protein